MNDEKIGFDIGLADGDGEVAMWGGKTADLGNRDGLKIRPGGEDTERDFCYEISFSFLMKKIILQGVPKKMVIQKGFEFLTFGGVFV